jgi:hypothetical protein
LDKILICFQGILLSSRHTILCGYWHAGKLHGTGKIVKQGLTILGEFCNGKKVTVTKIIPKGSDAEKFLLEYNSNGHLVSTTKYVEDWTVQEVANWVLEKVNETTAKCFQDNNIR